MGDRARAAPGEGRWQGEVEAAKAVEAAGGSALAREVAVTAAARRPVTTGQ